MMTDDPRAADLRDLLTESSKHSAYQRMPRRLRDRLGDLDEHVRSRHEYERLQFIRSHIDFQGRTVLDIGGNTGFFSFELLDLGARLVDMYEGNATHARFVRGAAVLLGLEDRLEVHPSYFDFDAEPAGRAYDFGLLLNVLHHVGDDFGDATMSMDAARDSIAAHLNRLSTQVRTLVFQLGYCWKGDRAHGLFAEGTKQEQIDFVRGRTDGAWRVRAIGIAAPKDGQLVYGEPTPENLARRDDLGEFLNRPMFILDSLHA